MIRTLLTALVLLSAVAATTAQSSPATEQAALKHAHKATAATAVGSDDLRDLRVDNSYTDDRLGVTYVYLQQCIGAVPIEGAVASVAMKGGRVMSFTHRFVSGLAERKGSVVPALDDQRAVARACNFLGQLDVPALAAKATGVSAPGRRRYAAPGFAHADLEVQDVFHADAEGQIRRAFAVSVDLRAGDLHRVFVDARTGEILRDQLLTQHCSFDSHASVRAYAEDGSCDGAGPEPGVIGLRPHHLRHQAASAKTTTTVLGDGASYRVFPWPAESPSHAARDLVSEPADPLASPFGWHDTNGAAGAEFQITRGNNAHAYVDALDTDAPSDPEPDGGAGLTFDFAYDATVEPGEQLDVTTTNLFYAVNMLHDFAWHYGFDEPAGNFQARNYTGRGTGGDYVLAESEDGARTIAATNLPNAEHLNNANFSTPSDGGNGRMQMFLWNVNSGGNAITIASPASLAGRDYGQLSLPSAGDWGAGTYVDSNTNITAGIYEVRDVSKTASFFDGCDAYEDPAAVRGKIAVIDRGTCQFGDKAFRAQQNGAVAVIICNFEDAGRGMAAGDFGARVTIPTFMMTQTGCQRLKLDARSNADFRLSIREPDVQGTAYLSGSLDNGIIAHEYGHGISTRLTGGPNVSCLGSAEQMGEGWSDFFSLVTSVRPGDRPEMRRGIGTYVERQPNDGGGIRPFPYSTDLSINPVTYAGVADADAFSRPHGIGSIWASMLWDLHWNMVDKYGFSDNLFGDTLGNNKAIQLVMTGLKLQPCGPGFVDGRDAILAADSLLYGGTNQKLIWETFARRGLGADADQGDPDNRSDGVAGFQLPLELADRTFFTKEVTKTVSAGEVVDVTLTFANYVDSVSVLPTVRITDEIPVGAQLLPASVSAPYVLNGDVLSFDYTNLSKGDSLTITYQFVTPQKASTLHWYEPIDEEADANNFDRTNEIEDASSFFELIQGDGYNDLFSFGFLAIEEETRPTLDVYEDREFTVLGDQPMFSFFHQYNLAAGSEAGVLSIYDASQGFWEFLPESAIVRNGYTNPVGYQAFSVPFLDGFAGDNLNDWEQVLVDLSAYAGKTVRLGWRFGRGANATSTGDGWFIDELAQIDAVTYNTEATVRIGTSVERYRAEDVGTLINYGTVVGTEEVAPDAVRFSAYPNPVNDDLNLVFAHAGGSATVQVISATGQVVGQQQFSAGQPRLQIGMQAYAPGVYAIRVERDGAVQVVRVVRQ